MSLSKPLTLRHLCHLLNNILGLFYHRHIVFFTISLVKNTKCYLPKQSAPEWPRNAAQLINCNTYVYTFHVCICLLALTFARHSTYLLKCSFQIYQKSIVVFIRSSKVWLKTTCMMHGLKAQSHGATFLRPCHTVQFFLQLATLLLVLLVDVKLANTRCHHSLLIYS